MTQPEYVPPEYGKEGFNCPSCQAYSHQSWNEIISKGPRTFGFFTGLRKLTPESVVFSQPVNNYLTENAGAISSCYKCLAPAYWIEGVMIYPSTSVAPLPNPDMPTDVMKIYKEARAINSLSPRASAALLRLALEELLPQVGAKKAGIDKMIGELVGNGIPKEIEQALDGMRVIGNEAIHPGVIDVEENPEIVAALFRVLNFIVDRMITQKNDINDIYKHIPQNKLDGIIERNQKASKQ